MELLFSFIALIISIIAITKLGTIESKLNDLQQKKPAPIPVSPLPTVESSPATEYPQQITQSTNEITNNSLPTTPSQPSGIEQFFTWYSHEWMLKTGALLILLGFVWLVTYAFLNNWVGPIGRITIGLVAGALILYFGERRLTKVRTQGITLVWLGASVMTISIYAAQMIYHMFPPTIALILFMLIMAATSFISLRHHSLSLSLAGLIIGGITPILIGSSEKNIFGLYSYLTVITIGTIWIAKYSKWRILTFLALIITSIYSMEYFFSSANHLMNSLTPLDFLYLRFAAVMLSSIFFSLTLITIITNKAVTGIDLITAGAVGLYTYGWINGLISHEYKGLVTATAALFYSGASFITFTRTSLKQPVYLYTAIAIILLAIATAFEFEGPVLITAFSIQALILPIIGVRLLGANIGKCILFYFALPIFLSIEAIISNWPKGLSGDFFYALTVVTFSLSLSGLYFYYNKRIEDKKLHGASVLIIVIGGIYGLIWIWKIFHANIDPEYLARMATLVAYTGIGLFTYITGEIRKRTILHKFGLFTLIFVLIRLLIFEVWGMELTGRIITFFMIGILLAGSVLLRKKPAQ